MDVSAILEKTRKALGDDADLSYINKEELEKAGRVKPTEITKVQWIMEGNSLTQYTDGHWEWWDGCLTKTRYTWNGALTQERIVNCANGLIHYRISA